MLVVALKWNARLALLSALIFATSVDAAVTNPLIFADFSDPDVIRRGDTYYMVSSSFNYMPGVPVLKSVDLVNWERIGYVMQNHPESKKFSMPQHGNGTWAPCIRFNDGKFWVFIPDPDNGIYVSNAVDPAGPWSEPHLLLPGAGIIDPAPLWDDDGNAYLLHAWAKSRSGINNILTLHRMSPDATQILDKGKLLIDGDRITGFTTLEGPKFYKRNGYYYIFAPAGGVTEGWQSVYRSRNIEGPYEYRIVLEQGMTDINGPHQGAWVTDSDGNDWFFHFQDRDAFGRILHLQSMSWKNDWPLMGKDLDGNGVGEPQPTLPLAVDQKAVAGLTTSDDFNQSTLGSQWQWNANWKSEWYSLRENPGQLRLYAQPKPEKNLWAQPALLTQMLYGPQMEVKTRVTLNADNKNAETGLILYGYDYAWLGLRSIQGKIQLVYETCLDTLNNCDPNTRIVQSMDGSSVELKVLIDQNALARFAWRVTKNESWHLLDIPEFQVKQGRWVGARVGLFAQSSVKGASADVDYFHVDVNLSR